MEPFDRRDFLLLGAEGIAMAPVASIRAQTSLSSWKETKAHRTEGHELDLRETGAAFDGRTDDTEALQDGINWVAQKGGGVCQLPWGVACVSELEIPQSVILAGAGGHTGTTVLCGLAPSGPVIRITGRSAGIRGVQISSTSDRFTSRYPGTLAHGIHATRGDIADLPTLSRLLIEDVYITNQPLDGVHVSGQIEHSRFDTVTVADCGRHGFAFDDGTRAGFVNHTYAFFMLYMARCRAIECAGNALLSGVRDQRYQPHNLILDHFEALGCCWRASAREIVQQIGLYNQQTILRQPDIEDQQYRKTKTLSTDADRLMHDIPSEGILCASNGVDMQQPYFSSLSKSVTVNPHIRDIQIKQPKIYAGAYSLPQIVAISIGNGVTEFEITGTSQPGAVDLVQSESDRGMVRVDGTIRITPPRIN